VAEDSTSTVSRLIWDLMHLTYQQMMQLIELVKSTQSL